MRAKLVHANHEKHTFCTWFVHISFGDRVENLTFLNSTFEFVNYFRGIYFFFKFSEISKICELATQMLVNPLAFLIRPER